MDVDNVIHSSGECMTTTVVTLIYRVTSSLMKDHLSTFTLDDGISQCKVSSQSCASWSVEMELSSSLLLSMMHSEDWWDSKIIVTFRMICIVRICAENEKTSYLSNPRIRHSDVLNNWNSIRLYAIRQNLEKTTLQCWSDLSMCSSSNNFMHIDRCSHTHIILAKKPFCPKSIDCHQIYGPILQTSFRQKQTADDVISSRSWNSRCFRDLLAGSAHSTLILKKFDFRENINLIFFHFALDTSTSSKKDTFAVTTESLRMNDRCIELCSSRKSSRDERQSRTQVTRGHPKESTNWWVSWLTWMHRDFLSEGDAVLMQRTVTHAGPRENQNPSVPRVGLQHQ